MDKSEAIASVEDAIRKLVQLSSKEKVWTQEMLLQVNDQSLRLLDVESQVRWVAAGPQGHGPAAQRDRRAGRGGEGGGAPSGGGASRGAGPALGGRGSCGGGAG